MNEIGEIATRALSRFFLARKDAKDGAAGQCRASANSNDKRARHEIPQPVGGGKKRKRAQAHELN